VGNKYFDLATENKIISKRAFKPNEKLNSFVKHLFNMSSAIRCINMADEIYSLEKVFFCTDKFIVIPVCMPAAEHEIAHLVEMNNPKRWTIPDFGLRFNENFNGHIRRCNNCCCS